MRADTLQVNRAKPGPESPVQQSAQHGQGPTSHERLLTLDAPRSTAHPHAHAHAHPAGSSGFPYEKLEAYQVALVMATLAKKLSEQVPRGHRNVADHMLRSASNTVLLLAEGANRRGAALLGWSRRSTQAEHERRFERVRVRVGRGAWRRCS